MTDIRANKPTILAAVTVAFTLSAAPAHAALIAFAGSDDGAGSLATAPNSVAAAISFDAAVTALGTKNIFTFESSPLGAFPSLTPASGVNLIGTNISGNNQSIVNTTSNINVAPPCTNASCGYNTTSGGSEFLLLFGGTATFSFGAGTEAFGAYLTGVQNGGETITFSDGTSESVAIPNPGFSGGTAFVGFMDAGKSIASVTINVNNDIVGLDDVRYIAPSVPEPASLALLGGALAGLALTRRRKHMWLSSQFRCRARTTTARMQRPDWRRLTRLRAILGRRWAATSAMVVPETSGGQNTMGGVIAQKF